MKRIMVTGATGMIGSTLIEEALENGIEVAAFIRPNSLKRFNLPVEHPLLKIVECEIQNYSALSPKSGEQAYDVFYHFAWDKTYGAQRDDVQTQMDNIQFTLDAVQMAKRFGCTAFVGAGSQAEFGPKEGVLHPSMPVQPQSGYGVAKYTAGKLSAILCGQLGIRHSWGRILSTYGEGDNAYTLIMYCIAQCISGEKLSLTNCDQIWDYLYGKDAAHAFFCIGEKGRDQAVYCVGSGQKRRLSEYVEIIRNQIDSSVEIGFGERMYYPDQVMYLCADITPLTEDTGFLPRFSFEEGIRNTIEWVKGREKT